MKKIIIPLVLILALITVSGHARAVNYANTVTPSASGAIETRLNLVEDIVPSLTTAGTSASCSLSVICIPSVNSIKATLQIQQLNNGRWNDYGASWNASSSTFYLSSSSTKSVASGYSYRLKVIIIASNGTNTGTVTEYS